jgi:hypothetical protein
MRRLATCQRAHWRRHGSARNAPCRARVHVSKRAASAGAHTRLCASRGRRRGWHAGRPDPPGRRAACGALRRSAAQAALR